MAEKVVFGGDHKTTEQLNQEKDAMLLRSEPRDQYQRLSKEYKRLKNGKVVTTDLVYNTKQGGDTNSKSILKYKQAWCKFTQTRQKCSKGEWCTFAHSKEEMDKHLQCQSLIDNYKTPKEMRSDDHKELCKNQQCRVKLRFLLKNTVLCTGFIGDGCKRFEGTCTFAHGSEQLKPLPKKELCWNFKKGACKLEYDECVYAHGKQELRYEGATTDYANVSYTADYTDAANANSADVQILCQLCQDLWEQVPKESFNVYFSLAN